MTNTGEDMEAFLILIIFVGIILYITSPFYVKGDSKVWEKSAVDSKMNKLAAAKDSHYKAIKDIDFEYAEGKLSEKDYNELRGYYKEKAIMTIKEIETLKRPSDHPSGHHHKTAEKEKGHHGKKEHR